MKRLILGVFVVVVLGVLVGCGGNDQDLDFRSVRDVELGVVFSLGQTRDEVETLLGQTKILNTYSLWLTTDSGMSFRFEDGVVVVIAARSHTESERFEIFGHRIGDSVDATQYFERFYYEDGSPASSFESAYAFGAVGHVIDDSGILTGEILVQVGFASWLRSLSNW